MSTYLTLYNLSVKIETRDQRIIQKLDEFLKNYYTVYQRAFGGNGEVNEVVYASKIKTHSVWYIHINQFKHFLSYLSEQSFVFDVARENVEDKRKYPVKKTSFQVRKQWKLREDQKPVNEFLMDSPEGSKLVPLNTGVGKAQPLTSLVKVPGGWTMMGDVKVGTVVTAKDGTPTKVTAVYPQGKTPTYKLTFRDGRTALASDEHLWKVFIANRKEEDRWEVMTTEKMKAYTEHVQPRVYIDLCDAEDIEDVTLPLKPYLLGALLGDGCFRFGSVKFSKNDQEILTKIEGMLPDNLVLTYQSSGCDYRISMKDRKVDKVNPLQAILGKMGLMETYSYEKFIPVYYLHASKQQRLELLQGLLDTDGTVGKQGSVSFCSSSLILAEQVQYLVRSLGGIARINVRAPRYSYKGEIRQGKPAYNVNIRYKKPSELFTLTRKKVLCNDNNQYAANLKLRVDKVEYIGEVETQCISIDHPERLYVTNDFVVTHNTFIALNAVGALRQRMGVIILPSFIEKWVSDIVEIHEASREDVMVVQGAKAITSIVQLAREGNFNNDYVIISSRTMQDFIKMFEEEPETCAEMYGCTPVELFPILGIGILLIDETHMSFHAIFKIALHTNVKFHIGLSATLISEELVVSRAHKVLYPSKNTYGDTMLKRYIDIYPIEYNIAHNLVKHIKTENYGSKFYSHTAFEQSILKKGFLLESYIKLIKSTMEDYYVADYMEGDKLMIFVATVKLASVLTERLQDEYPDKVVKRYCEGDSYDEMLEGDIIVTTVISAGTGLDIPNLRVAIQTVSVSSTVSNIQSAGRLRFLKDRDVKFCYLYAANIPKQREYHLKRMDIFKDRAANIVMRRSGVDLN